MTQACNPWFSEGTSGYAWLQPNVLILHSVGMYLQLHCKTYVKSST